jgi:hypothetical protein
MSEQILLLNPRPRKRRRYKHNRARRRRMPAALRRYWASKRRGSSHNRRRPRRRYAHNRRRFAKRARRRSYAHNRIRYRARRYKHNRRSFGMPRGIVGGYVTPAVVGALGGIGLDVIWGYLSPRLPAQLQSGWVGAAAKSATAIGLAVAGGRFVPRMRRQFHVAGLGAVTIIAATAIKGALQGMAPNVPGLSGYIDYQSYALPGARLHGYMPRAGTLGGLDDAMYSPAAVIQPPGTPVPRQFGGYIAVQPHMYGSGGFSGYDWTNDGM